MLYDYCNFLWSKILQEYNDPASMDNKLVYRQYSFWLCSALGFTWP
jgi:hypothetical protein